MTLEQIKFEGPRTNIQVIEEEEQVTSKDLLEEERIQAIQNLSKYKKNKGVVEQESKARQLSPRDFVLKRKTTKDTIGKFQQKWEGPYLITRKNKPGSFHLVDMNGKKLDHTWNIKAL